MSGENTSAVNEPRSILITGAHGFTGKHLVRKLQGETTARLHTPTRKELSLVDALAVEDYLRSNEVDVIVHLASSLDRREIIESQESQWLDTFAAGRSVATAAARAEVGLLIAIGSMDEVGKHHGTVAADAVVEPLTTHGLAKSLVLETCRFLSARSSLQVEWMRPTTIYGPGQSGPMLVPSAFEAACSDGHGLFTSGQQLRDFIFIDDLVDWLSRAARLQYGSPGVRIHHVGTGSPVRVAEVLTTVAELAGGDFKLGAIPRRPGEPELLTVPTYEDSREPLRGWKATTEVPDGLRLTWDWWKSQASEEA